MTRVNMIFPSWRSFFRGWWMFRSYAQQVRPLSKRFAVFSPLTATQIGYNILTQWPGAQRISDEPSDVIDYYVVDR